MKKQAGAEVVTVAILPGLLCDGRMFAAQVDAFGAVVVDGFYGRARRIEDMATYALDRLPGRVSLLGHSMGARVALEMMRRAPERIDRLALADTGVHGVGAGETAKRHALVELGRRQGAEALVEAWLPPMVAPSRRADARLMACLRGMAVEAGVDVFACQVEALLHRPDARAGLAAIGCPTLVVVGEKDEWSPVAQHREIADLVPGAQLRTLPGAGHMAPAEAPDAFNAALREWLSW